MLLFCLFDISVGKGFFGIGLIVSLPSSSFSFLFLPSISSLANYVFIWFVSRVVLLIQSVLFARSLQN